MLTERTESALGNQITQSGAGNDEFSYDGNGQFCR
jgi:hypothetical protein